MTQATFKTKEGVTILAVVEQAKEIVQEVIIRGFEAYKNYTPLIRSWCGSAIYSLDTLIESSGLTFTPEQDVLIIKVN